MTDAEKKFLDWIIENIDPKDFARAVYAAWNNAPEPRNDFERREIERAQRMRIDDD